MPAGCDIKFADYSYWRDHFWQIMAVLALLFIQGSMIAVLFAQRRSARQAAAALADSERRMSLATRAASLTTWMWNVGREKVWTTLRQQTRPTTEVQMDLADVLARVHPADRDAVDRAVHFAVERDEDLDIEYRVLQPDGSVRWFAVRGRAETEPAGWLMGVAQDITNRKMAELQAEKDRSALTHMTRVSMLGQLSASIAHQLNQPLAAILGNAEAARKMLGRDQIDVAELQDICDDIVTEDIRAADVIRRLGALFKHGEMRLVSLDMNELVCDTLELLRSELMTRHVETNSELAPSMLMIEGDRIQLQQVLLNLILNAADAMNGSELPQRTITIRTELAGANVRLSVADHGTGIAPDDLKHVFDAFWSTKAGGMGIGLAICQSIVVAHRGTLTAANNPGGGATFSVALPTRQTPEA